MPSQPGDYQLRIYVGKQIVALADFTVE
jgi:hypothetical protein